MYIKHDLASGQIRRSGPLRRQLRNNWLRWKAASSIFKTREVTSLSWSWEQMRVWALHTSWEVDFKVGSRTCQLRMQCGAAVWYGVKVTQTSLNTSRPNYLIWALLQR